jgi:hypothetical protein
LACSGSHGTLLAGFENPFLFFFLKIWLLFDIVVGFGFYQPLEPYADELEFRESPASQVPLQALALAIVSIFERED